MELFILFCSGILLGISYVLEKKLVVEKFHPATFVVLISSVSTLLSLPLLLYQFKTPIYLLYWILTIGSVIAYGLGFLCSIKAYRKIDASTVGLVSRLNIIITALLAILLLKERYSFISYIALGLIFVGSLLIVFEKGRVHINYGVVYAILMACGYAISAVIDKEILRHFSPFTYVVINNFFVALVFSSVKEARKEAYSLFVKKSSQVIVISLFSISSWVGFLFVLQSGSVSRIYPIFESVALVSTVGAGIVFLKETDKLIQKIIGSVIIISGIFLFGM